MDVNQIFRDLATFVHEQGETVDSIEAHIESSTIRVSEGVQQLQKASNYAVTFNYLEFLRNSLDLYFNTFSRQRQGRNNCVFSGLVL